MKGALGALLDWDSCIVDIVSLEGYIKIYQMLSIVQNKLTQELWPQQFLFEMHMNCHFYSDNISKIKLSPSCTSCKDPSFP